MTSTNAPTEVTSSSALHHARGAEANPHLVRCRFQTSAQPAPVDVYLTFHAHAHAAKRSTRLARQKVMTKGPDAGGEKGCGNGLTLDEWNFAAIDGEMAGRIGTAKCLGHGRIIAS
jgi:hypothetical protein